MAGAVLEHRFLSCCAYLVLFIRPLDARIVCLPRFIASEATRLRNAISFHSQARHIRCLTHMVTVYAIGALLKPEVFLAIRDDKEQSITFKSTKRSYREAFSDDAILRTFEEFANDPGRKDIYRSRNVLTHRAVSPRAFQMGRPDLPAAHLERLEIVFDEKLTSSRMLSAQRLLLTCLETSADFVNRHF